MSSDRIHILISGSPFRSISKVVQYMKGKDSGKL
ncbi:MAG: hypothetical protein IJT08_02835 [Alphaproteobacteria bacterium]|nr:hypothetical protein [Alphaproteobacteria bacterium]